MNFIEMNEKINLFSRKILHTENRVKRIFYKYRMKNTKTEVKEAKIKWNEEHFKIKQI